MFKFTIRELASLTLIVGLVACGCSWGRSASRKAPPPLTLPKDAEGARAKLLEEIPAGISMDDARKRLSDRGFKVSAESEDKLRARLDQPYTWAVTCNWLVEVEGDRSLVKDVSVKVMFTGP
jgi:hypothetical protein